MELQNVTRTLFLDLLGAEGALNVAALAVMLSQLSALAFSLMLSLAVQSTLQVDHAARTLCSLYMYVIQGLECLEWRCFC